MVRNQARPRPQEQEDLVPAGLDELDGAGVRDALRGFPIDLHNLVPDLDREQHRSYVPSPVSLPWTREPLSLAQRPPLAQGEEGRMVAAEEECPALYH